MPTKRPLKPAPTSDITDEWGIYDPAKAGMPALFARLGRPVLQAAPTSTRRERRRALRPERSGEGVGLAIAEAQRRAGLEPVDEHPLLGGNPARAIRLALRAQTAASEVNAPSTSPFMPPAAAPAAPPVVETPVVADAAPIAKKRTARKAATTRPAPDASQAAATPAAEGAPVTKPRPRRLATRSKARVATGDVATAASAVAAAPTTAAVTPVPPEPAPLPAAVAPPAPRPVVAAPSPRRPRGPVPLAAWAQAVPEPKPEPRRDDKRGFWRGFFRIPAEVALVEYAHGAKIHRLVIEAGDDLMPDFI